MFLVVAGAEAFRGWASGQFQNARPLGPQEGPDLGRAPGTEGGKTGPCPQRLPSPPDQGGPPRLMTSPFSPPAIDILNYYFLCNQAVSNPFQQVRAAGQVTGWGRTGLRPRLRGPKGG